MSDSWEVHQFNSEFPEGPAIQVRAPVLKELVRTRIQLVGGPYIHERPEVDDLQVLSDRDWVNWSLVQGILTKRVRNEMISGTPVDSVQLGLLASPDWAVNVLIEYLVDDYWWVVCLMPVMEDYEEWKEVLRGGSAAAVLFIEGSGSILADTSRNPTWFIAGS